jgi:hypothetical protein
MTTDLEGRFYPERWERDHPVSDGPTQVFDAGAALLSLSADQLRVCLREAARSGDRDFDALAEAAGLVGAGSAHDGPFSVDVEADDMVEFLADLGMDDPATLTDAHVSEMRSLHEERARTPSPR